MKLILDIAVINCSGERDNVADVAHTGYIHNATLKAKSEACMTGGAEKHRYCACGDGNLDFKEILSACKEAGVEYALVEQDNPSAERQRGLLLNLAIFDYYHSNKSSNAVE